MAFVAAHPLAPSSQPPRLLSSSFSAPLCCPTSNVHVVHRRVAAVTMDTSSPSPSPPSTSVSLSFETSPLREGIKAIAVGKHGEKPIPIDLVEPIEHELQAIEKAACSCSCSCSADMLYLRASFLGSLFMKRTLQPYEQGLLHRAVMLPRTAKHSYGRIRGDVTAAHIVATVTREFNTLTDYAFRLLCDERLSMDEAEKLGQLLYANEDPVPIKALIAHVMRVRHESDDELAGLAKAVTSTTAQLSASSVHVGPKRYILLAEPFDGALTWDLLTPLIAQHLMTKYLFQVILPCGPTSGPKYGPNVASLYAHLNNDVDDDRFGILSDQWESNPGLGKWVHMRQVILKRPALATVEKFADPSPNADKRADIFIASVFHPGYVDKMAHIARELGYRAFIIVSKGSEGCLGQLAPIRDGFSSGVNSPRVYKALVGWRADESSGFKYDTQTVLHRCDNSFTSMNNRTSEIPKKGQACVEQNAQKIGAFAQDGTSGEKVFDARVNITCALMDQAMELIQEQVPAIFKY